jgi:hypothetical protein
MVRVSRRRCFEVAEEERERAGKYCAGRAGRVGHQSQYAFEELLGDVVRKGILHKSRILDSVKVCTF